MRTILSIMADAHKVCAASLGLPELHVAGRYVSSLVPPYKVSMQTLSAANHVLYENPDGYIRTRLSSASGDLECEVAAFNYKFGDIYLETLLFYDALTEWSFPVYARIHGLWLPRNLLARDFRDVPEAACVQKLCELPRLAETQLLFPVDGRYGTTRLNRLALFGKDMTFEDFVAEKLS